jgi:hypothetical protein
MAAAPFGLHENRQCFASFIGHLPPFSSSFLFSSIRLYKILPQFSQKNISPVDISSLKRWGRILTLQMPQKSVSTKETAFPPFLFPSLSYIFSSFSGISILSVSLFFKASSIFVFS